MKITMCVTFVFWWVRGRIVRWWRICWSRICWSRICRSRICRRRICRRRILFRWRIIRRRWICSNLYVSWILIIRTWLIRLHVCPETSFVGYIVNCAINSISIVVPIRSFNRSIIRIRGFIPLLCISVPVICVVTKFVRFLKKENNTLKLIFFLYIFNLENKHLFLSSEQRETLF